MTHIAELTEEAFAARFKPIRNHLNEFASFDWGDGFGTLFETYGEELAFVLAQDAHKVWTLCTGIYYYQMLGLKITYFDTCIKYVKLLNKKDNLLTGFVFLPLLYSSQTEEVIEYDVAYQTKEHCMSLITLAITTAVSKLAESTISDLYHSLKQHITNLFGQESQLVQSIDSLEVDPTSKGRQLVVDEEVQKSKADQNEELVKIAEQILASLNQSNSASQTINSNQNIRGSGNAVAGPYGTATVNNSNK